MIPTEATEDLIKKGKEKKGGKEKQDLLGNCAKINERRTQVLSDSKM